MASKLSEMDEVVKMIHINALRNLENDQGQTLLVCDYHFVAFLNLVLRNSNDLFIMLWTSPNINTNMRVTYRILSI